MDKELVIEYSNLDGVKSESAIGLSALWNYDKKVIYDVVDVTGTFEEASELLGMMESEELEKVFDAVEMWRDWHGRDPDYKVEEDFNYIALERLCIEEGVCFNEFKNVNVD